VESEDDKSRWNREEKGAHDAGGTCLIVISRPANQKKKWRYCESQKGRETPGDHAARVTNLGGEKTESHLWYCKKSYKGDTIHSYPQEPNHGTLAVFWFEPQH